MIENPDEWEVDANIAERALEEQAQLRRPVFTHEELRELATAITEHIENQVEDEEPPKPAVTAQEKLDRYFASFAEPV